MNLPPIARLRQRLDQPHVHDAEQAARLAVLGSRIQARVRPQGSVAVAVGSRGIRAIVPVVRGVLAALNELGLRPFVVAAMGSHGGATEEGQRALLAGYGINEGDLGVPVRTDMDTEVVGTSDIGLPIHFDRNALHADGIVLVNRVKPHTDFVARHESGLLKMLVIGLGKRAGAEQVHRLGLRGMTQVMPSVGRYLIGRTPLALGLAIVENAADWPARLVAVEPEDLLAVEPGLLDEARALMGRLPFDQIDVLIVGELGKNYSGAGMDPNVIGRRLIETQPDLERPRITRIAVLDVSDESHGNAVGTGFADLTTERLLSRLDLEPFRINVLTSSFLERARIPIALPTDRAVVETALETCWRLDPAAAARMVVIPNTLELDTLWITQALEPEARQAPGLEIETGFEPFPFGPDDTLDQERLFPESTRARRPRATRA